MRKRAGLAKPAICLAVAQKRVAQLFFTEKMAFGDKQCLLVRPAENGMGDDVKHEKTTIQAENGAEESASSTLSVREFARQLGKHHSWVQRRVEEGKITADENGRIPVETGFDEVRKLVEEPTPKEVEREAARISTAKGVADAYSRAKLAEKTYQAKLREIEYQMKRGELVERSAIEADAFRTASALRGRLMSIPVRIAGLCEGRTSREIEEIIEAALNDALNEFKKSEFSTWDAGQKPSGERVDLIRD